MSVGMVLLIILIVMLFGGYHWRGDYGSVAYGVPGVLIIILLVLLVTGRL